MKPDEKKESPPRIVTIEADFTLRDLFAAAALGGIASRLIAVSDPEEVVCHHRAILAYAYADAMLKARLVPLAEPVVANRHTTETCGVAPKKATP